MAESTRPEDAQLIESFDDLLAPLEEAARPTGPFLVGAEMERFGVLEGTGAPVGYDGEGGVRRLLEALCEAGGWEAVPPEREGGPLLALTRPGGASVTLEPGAQLELSGAPHADVHAIADELDEHLDEVARLSAPLGVRWLGLGFHPWARQEDLPWVPKTRYGFMKRWLPTRGAHGLDMMRRTSTVQANFDFASEPAAMRTLRFALRASPIVTAMFANSPFLEGRAFGGKSYRAKVWLDVDPARQGLVPRVLHEGSSFADYVEWALDAPMFLVLRPEGPVENTGQTFRRFWKDGFAGHRATRADWLTHLNTMFPEVRLKKTIEVRGADSQGREMAIALSALWTGLLYDERALAEGEAVVAEASHDELAALRPEVAASGLGASLRGVPLSELAQKLVEAARGGLSRRDRIREGRGDESGYLAPLARLVERGRCPADDLLDRVASAVPRPGEGQAETFRRVVEEVTSLDARSRPDSRLASGA